nr:MAG: hypothetical protein DIU75_25160 [Mycolicibacterium hassiacum]
MKHCLIAMTSIGGWLAESWALMIAIGVVHSEWLPGLPTISYASALRVSLAVTLVAVVVRFFRGVAEELAKEQADDGR